MCIHLPFIKSCSALFTFISPSFISSAAFLAPLTLLILPLFSLLHLNPLSALLHSSCPPFLSLFISLHFRLLTSSCPPSPSCQRWLYQVVPSLEYCRHSQNTHRCHLQAPNPLNANHRYCQLSTQYSPVT